MGWGAFFGVAAGVVLVLTLAMRPRTGETGAVVVAWVLLASWASSNLLTLGAGIEGAAIIYPLMDVAGLFVVTALALRQPAAWKLLVAGAYVGQLGLHALFWSGGAATLGYALGLNLLYATQLLAVGWPGLQRLAAVFFEWLLVSPRDYEGPLRRAGRVALAAGLARRPASPFSRGGRRPA